MDDGNVAHEVEQKVVRRARSEHRFVVTCTCGWRSDELLTSGMAAAESDRHLQDAAGRGAGDGDR